MDKLRLEIRAMDEVGFKIQQWVGVLVYLGECLFILTWLRTTLWRFDISVYQNAYCRSRYCLSVPLDHLSYNVICPHVKLFSCLAMWCCFDYQQNYKARLFNRASVWIRSNRTCASWWRPWTEWATCLLIRRPRTKSASGQSPSLGESASALQAPARFFSNASRVSSGWAPWAACRPRMS